MGIGRIGREDNKNINDTQHSEDINEADYSKKEQEENLSIGKTKPIIYSDNDCKSVEDYGEYVKIIGKMTDYTLTGVLYTGQQENYSCYIPPASFLGKYSSLYYEPDEITEDLLGCFVDW
jgi:hypothetical protein